MPDSCLHEERVDGEGATTKKKMIHISFRGMDTKGKRAKTSVVYCLTEKVTKRHHLLLWFSLQIPSSDDKETFYAFLMPTLLSVLVHTM